MEKTRLSSALLSALLGCLLGCAREPPPELPVLAEVPEFSLIERSGRGVTLEDLRGQVWVADFIFTHCAGPCPLLSTRMSQLAEALGADSEVRFVSFSVDPQRDTPQALREYAKRYGADPERWLFLTGQKGALYALIRDGFKLAVDDGSTLEGEQPGAGLITHSVRLALIDRRGRVRGYYIGTEDGVVERIARDVRALLAEPG